MSGFRVPSVGESIAAKYNVQAVIGSGGMGVVLAAVHVELGHMVAIKVMRAESSPYHVERFRREARIVARLRSDHVARVTDYGQLPSGSPFVVMDYLEGRDVDAELRTRGTFPIEEAVGHVLCACEAIAEAHAHGIVHRDIKPKNLFLAARAGSPPVLKVLDFGLAKVGPREDPSITGSQDIFGSPSYMAPEQMRSAKDVDARADIWALGVTLYEMIAGEGPFDAPSVPEICAMVLKDPAPPLRAKRADVPPGLAKIVHRCLLKDPAQRFPTVLELAQELEPYAPAIRAGMAQRIEAIVNAPTSNPSLPPVGSSSGNISDVDTAAGGNSEELTVEMATARGRAAPAARSLPRRRSNIGVAAALAAIVVIGGAAALVSRRAPSPTAALSEAPPVAATPLVPAEPAPVPNAAPSPPAPTIASGESGIADAAVAISAPAASLRRPSPPTTRSSGAALAPGAPKASAASAAPPPVEPAAPPPPPPPPTPAPSSKPKPGDML